MFLARRHRTLTGSATDDEVALKLYYTTVESARVEREIAAMEHMRHPTLAGLIEHGDIEILDNNTKFVTWQFIRGTPLDTQIAAGPLAPRGVAIVGRDVASAIHEIWSKRIVHRDIKPANIMLTDGDVHAVLIDLGVARYLGEASLTAYGFTWGTVGYMSPEQCRTERNLTCKSDMFALGVVLLETLSGRHPTLGDQNRLAAGTIPKSSTINPLLPGAFASLLDSLLAPRAAFRPDPQVAALEFERWAALL